MRLRLSEFRSFPRKRGSKFSSCIPITGSLNGGAPERYIFCHYEGVTIKNDLHGPTDKEMRLSLSVIIQIKGDVPVYARTCRWRFYRLDRSAIGCFGFLVQIG
jgi:hypothetical protein